MVSLPLRPPLASRRSNRRWKSYRGNLTEGVTATISTMHFDLDGDGEIDLNDVQWWLTAAAANQDFANPFIFGDANLDGVVDVSDFNLWNGNKFTSGTTWSQGDFNADGVVDVADFNVWNGNKWTDSAIAVPEPGSLALAAFGFTALGIRSSCRRWRP